MKKKNKKNKMKKRLFQYAKKVKFYLLAGIIMIPIAVYFQLKAPLYVAHIINNLLKDGVGITNYSEFLENFIKYGAFVALSAVINYSGNIFLSYGSNKTVLNIQNDIFEMVQRFPISYFDSMAAGKISSRVANDPSQIKELFQTVLSRFFLSFVTIAGIVIATIKIEPSLLIFFAIPVPILYLSSKHYARVMADANGKLRRFVADINAMFNETIITMDVIRAFNAEKKRKSEFDELNTGAFKEDQRLTRLYSYCGFNLMNAVQNLTIFIIIFYFGLKVVNGKSDSTVGMIFVFVNYATTFFNNLSNSMMDLGTLQRSFAAAEHAFELLDIDLKLDDLNSKGIVVDGDVEFNHVNFSYVDGEKVISDLTFKIKEGSSVGIVGRTGAGKSSLMNLLFRFYSPDSGKILIGDKDINKIPIVDLRRDMSIVIQDPFLFMGTIESNVSLNKPSISTEDVEDALKKVGAERLINKLENGVKTKVSEQGMTYSLGERQLISFARALVHDPKILVLDEATANIDSETEKLIQNGINTIKEGRTTFIIAHRLSTIMNCDTIIVLDKGEIKEMGRHEELLLNRGIYYDMWTKSNNNKEDAEI